MKKVLVILLTVVLAFSAFATTAFAAISPQKPEGIITDATSTDSVGAVWKISIVDVDDLPTLFEKEIKNDEKISDHKKITLEGSGNPNFPLEVTFTAAGITSTSKGYILFKGLDGKIIKLDVTMGEGIIKATFPALGEFTLVLKDEKTTGSTDVPKSDPTSDNFTTVAFFVLLSGIAVSLVSIKKIKSVA